MKLCWLGIHNWNKWHYSQPQKEVIDSPIYTYIWGMVEDLPDYYEKVNVMTVYRTRSCNNCGLRQQEIASRKDIPSS